MLAQFAAGFLAPIESIGYLNRNRLWKYAVLPLFLSAAVVFVFFTLALIWIFSLDLSALENVASNWHPLLQWLIAFLGIVFKIIVLLLVFIILMRFYLLLYSIMVVPFLSPLVEKILQLEGLESIKVSMLEIFNYVIATIIYNIKLLLMQLLISLLLLLVGPLQPVLNFFVTGYFTGRSCYDYVFELLSKPQQFAALARPHLLEMTGVGVFTNLAMAVPVLGTIFVPLLSVVAATRLYIQHYKKQ